MPEPITQAPNTEANTTGAPGAEARIAELTAARGDAERKYNELMQQHEALKLKYENTASAVAASLGVQTQPNQPAIDPNVASMVQAIVTPILQEVRQVVGGLRMNDAQRALQETIQQNRVPEPVAKRAQEIYQEYAKKGIILKEDVVRRQAWGEVAEQEHLKSIAATATRQSFNTPYQNMGNGAELPLRSQVQAEKPANFDSLSAREQVQWYEKNVGNQPL